MVGFRRWLNARKKLENGTGLTMAVASSFLSEKRVGEENAGTPEILSPKALGYRRKRKN